MAERRTVEIVYATASRNGSRSRRTIAPYYLQPYERSWLAIAMDTLRGDVRMFKVDRIESCRLTAERFEMPEDFDPVSYLGPAWGVLRGASGPAEDVVLHFKAEERQGAEDRSLAASRTTARMKSVTVFPSRSAHSAIASNSAAEYPTETVTPAPAPPGRLVAAAQSHVSEDSRSSVSSGTVSQSLVGVGPVRVACGATP
jgi:predicted DNA-binding transcriptional regulator YafY